MPTKTISTYKQGVQVDATHYLTVSLQPCTIYAIEGQASGSGALYLQLIGTATPTTGVTVPLWSKLITGGTGFSFVYPMGEQTRTMTYPVANTAATQQGSNVLPVYLAISSTIGVWTSTAVSVDADVTIDLPSVDAVNTLLSKNNGTGGVLTVWADSVANTNLRLTTLTLNNAGYGTAVYFQLFSFAPTAGAIPYAEWPATANQAQINLTFGGGLFVQQASSDYVEHYGCFVGISSTPLTYTDGGTGNAILTSGTYATIS